MDASIQGSVASDDGDDDEDDEDDYDDDDDDVDDNDRLLSTLRLHKRDNSRD